MSRVLLVEPDHTVARSLSRVLARAGWQVTHCTTATEAREHLSDSRRYDAVVTHAGRYVPVASVVVALADRLGVPVCVYSARGPDSSEADLADRWIQKPEVAPLVAWLTGVMLTRRVA